MNADLVHRVERACQDLLATAPRSPSRRSPPAPAPAGPPSTGAPSCAPSSKNTAAPRRDALTLTGLAVQIDQLRGAVEALAAKADAPSSRSRSSAGAGH